MGGWVEAPRIPGLKARQWDMLPWLQDVIRFAFCGVYPPFVVVHINIELDGILHCMECMSLLNICVVDSFICSLIHVCLSFEEQGGIRGGGYAQLGDAWEEFVVTGRQSPSSGEWSLQRRYLRVDSTVMYQGYADLHGVWGVYLSKKIEYSQDAPMFASGLIARQPRVFRIFRDDSLEPEFPWSDSPELEPREGGAAGPLGVAEDAIQPTQSVVHDTTPEGSVSNPSLQVADINNLSGFIAPAPPLSDYQGSTCRIHMADRALSEPSASRAAPAGHLSDHFGGEDSPTSVDCVHPGHWGDDPSCAQSTSVPGRDKSSDFSHAEAEIKVPRSRRGGGWMSLMVALVATHALAVGVCVALIIKRL